ncbi:MAG: extracellular solute-binding protein, partial [Oscillospiraceae bacterium]
MKNFKRIIAGALCLATMATILSSCDGNSNVANSDDKIEAEKSTDLQIMVSGVDENQTSNATIKAMKKFEEQYKRDIEFVTCGYDEWNQKVMASIASGAPIDVVNGSTYQYPLFAMKGYAQPIDEFVNLKSKFIDIDVMKSLFSYQGKYYNASPLACSLPLIIYYNKDLFASEGVDDPYELYQKDEWTFTKFKEVAKQFTKDTNGDGKTDQWGLAAWYQWVFFGGSAASVCKINDQGNYELNMDNNPALNEALELIQSGWSTDKWIGLEGGDIYDSFYKGKNAMINEFTWAGKTIWEEYKKETFAFDVGAVPFPYGESNPEKYNYCFSDGFSILSKAGAPYSAGKLIDMILEETVALARENEGKVPKEWEDMYKELQKKPFN